MSPTKDPCLWAQSKARFSAPLGCSCPGHTPGPEGVPGLSPSSDKKRPPPVPQAHPEGHVGLGGGRLGGRLPPGSALCFLGVFLPLAVLNLSNGTAVSRHWRRGTGPAPERFLPANHPQSALRGRLDQCLRRGSFSPSKAGSGLLALSSPSWHWAVTNSARATQPPSTGRRAFHRQSCPCRQSALDAWVPIPGSLSRTQAPRDGHPGV